MSALIHYGKIAAVAVAAVMAAKYVAKKISPTQTVL